MDNLRESKVKKFQENIEDELELLELFDSLWKGKWFILSMTLSFIFVTALYFFLKAPVYQAKITLISPIAADIAVLNLERFQNKDLKPISVKDAHNVFKGVLFAESTIQSFRKENPKILITVESPSSYSISVTAQGFSEQVVSDAVKSYVNRAEQIAIDRLNGALTKELNDVALHLQKKMKVAQESAHAQQQAQLIRLKEALHIAKAIDLKQPRSLADHSAYTDLNNPAYLRGSQALTAEIEHIEKRSANDLFNNNFSKLQKQYGLVQQMVKESKNFRLARIDEAIVLDNTTSLQSKKRWILLSGILGGLLGILLLIMRQMKTMHVVK